MRAKAVKEKLYTVLFGKYCWYKNGLVLCWPLIAHGKKLSKTEIFPRGDSLDEPRINGVNQWENWWQAEKFYSMDNQNGQH